MRPRAAKDVTGTVPIVMAYSVSPVELGVVQSLQPAGRDVYPGLTMNVGSELPGARDAARVSIGDVYGVVEFAAEKRLSAMYAVVRQPSRCNELMQGRSTDALERVPERVF